MSRRPSIVEQKVTELKNAVQNVTTQDIKKAAEDGLNVVGTVFRKRAESVQKQFETAGQSIGQVGAKVEQALKTLTTSKDEQERLRRLNTRKSIGQLAKKGGLITGTLSLDEQAQSQACELKIEATRVGNTEEELGTPPATPDSTSSNIERKVSV